MKLSLTSPVLFCVALAFIGCDARVNTAPPVIEKKETTIVNPPAEKKVEKKVENNTTIVNPPAEKKE
jgi:hypothetical protein